MNTISQINNTKQSPTFRSIQPGPAPDLIAIMKGQSNDTLVKSESDPKERVGIVQKYQNTVSKARKSIASASGYTKGVSAGLIKGFLVTCLTFTTLSIASGVKNLMKKTSKNSSKLNWFLSITAGIATTTYNMYRADLAVNKKHAELDHTYQTGHVAK